MWTGASYKQLKQIPREGMLLDSNSYTTLVICWATCCLFCCFYNGLPFGSCPMFGAFGRKRTWISFSLVGLNNVWYPIVSCSLLVSLSLTTPMCATFWWVVSWLILVLVTSVSFFCAGSCCWNDKSLSRSASRKFWGYGRGDLEVKIS